jgi:hypothetical protein
MKIDDMRNVNCNSDTLWLPLSRKEKQARYFERASKENIQNILVENSNGKNR